MRMIRREGRLRPKHNIYHGGTEARRKPKAENDMTNSGEGTGTGSKLLYEELTEKIIGAAIEVHKAIGQG